MNNSIKRGVSKVGAFVLAAALIPACVLQEKDDVSKFQEAIPEADHVKVSGPEDAQKSGGASGQSIQADEPWASGPWAKYYGFTRHVRKGVNQVTAAILGSVWIIVHTQPTSVDSKEAVWGPWTDSLEPVTYRFRVTEVGEKEYEYRLEGRPKASSNDGEFKSVLFGTGFGKGHASHGDGTFTIDLDVAYELDPFNQDGDSSGKIKITHDLPPDITTNLFSQPRSIKAEVTPSNDDSWYTVASDSLADGTGTLKVDAYADADDSNATQKEDISILSQWNGTGAGRADITLSGGDVPTDPGTVKAVECWGSDFYRVYYEDSVNYQSKEGEASLCAFASAPAI
ncbi:MAG: hypothetical protein IPI67_22060 [Myxococcales bacterium]|nr:hypothetical protein [Myxococcales bacterium]